MTQIISTFKNFKTLPLKLINNFNIFSFISIFKFRLIILFFIFIYSIFLLIMIYILYKSYLLSLNKLNEFMYNNMSHDISRLNWNYPIYSYTENIPSINHINYVYHKLDILNYNDYIYNISHNSQVLHSLLDKNQELQSKTSSVVLADIIYQNSQLFVDLTEHYLKRLVKLSLPLMFAIGLLGSIWKIKVDTAVS